MHARTVWRAIEQAWAGALPDPWREPPDAFARMPVQRSRNVPTDEVNR